MADKPTTDWDETAPANTDAISLGDDKIRELKTQIREVIAADHTFESSGQGEGWGYHKQATLMEGADPAAVTDAMLVYTKAVSGKAELFVRDEDGTIQQLTSVGQFIGGMLKEVRMWSGALAGIGDGWALCDGTGGLPNLIAKFIRGVATAGTDPGSEGGSDTNAAVNPSHTHSYGSTDGAHQHEWQYSPNYLADYAFAAQAIFSTSGSYNNVGINSYGGSGTEAYIHTHTTVAQGSGSAFENRPAYFELAFIART